MPTRSKQNSFCSVLLMFAYSPWIITFSEMVFFGPSADWEPSDEWRELGVAPDDSFFKYTGSYVYVIGRREPNGWKTAVRVGQTTDLEQRMENYKGKLRVIGATRGRAVVKWSRIGSGYINEVESYLIRELDPLLNDQIPEVEPEEIDLPHRVTSP